MKKISCIIPTYNEEAHIASILRVLAPLVGDILYEVIVIDDCSSDDTRSIVRTFEGVTLVTKKENGGKSKAIAEGMSVAEGDSILMLDGDLINFQEGNVRDLVMPIMEGKADVTISIRGNTPQWWTRLFYVETFSGERCFAKELFAHQLGTIEALSGYGLEVYMNEHIIKHSLRIQPILMRNVTIDFKWHKHGLFVGVWKELCMWREIFSVVGPWRLGWQIMNMRKLCVQ